jgi:hypothetical protein
LRDVATIAVSSAWRHKSTWCKGEGMPLKYKLNRTGESTLSYPSTLARRDDVAVWKDASKVRPRRYDEIIWTMCDGKFRSVSM